MNSHCTTCMKETTWVDGTKSSRCSECKTGFPCRSKCQHWDCREARGEVTVCACGRYLEPGETHCQQETT